MPNWPKSEKTMVRLTPAVRTEVELAAQEERRSLSAITRRRSCSKTSSSISAPARAARSCNTQYSAHYDGADADVALSAIIRIDRNDCLVRSLRNSVDGRWTMSALPPKADISRTSGHVRFVPKADIRTLRCIDTQEGRARPGARQPTTPITGRILWRVLPLS